MKYRIGNRIFMTTLLVSIVPMCIILFYILFIYSHENRQNVEQNRVLIQKSYAGSLENLFQKTEYVSNICYEPQVQNLLVKQERTGAERYQIQNELASNLNQKVDLFRILNLLDAISIEDASGYIYKIKGNGEPFIRQHPEVRETVFSHYKYHQILDMGNGDGEIVYARGIRSIHGYGSVIGVIYLEFSLKDYMDALLANEQDTKMLFALVDDHQQILYSNCGDEEQLEKIRAGERLRGYRENRYDLDYNGLSVVFYDNNAALMQQVHRLRAMIFLVIILSCFGIIIVEHKLIGSLVEPILILQKRTVRARQGTYECKKEIIDKGELSDLEDSFNDMMHQLDFMINEVYSKELSEKEAVIASLTAQINPHFLYNTLDMVKSMAELEGLDEIGDIVKALSTMFRYSTHTDRLLVTVQEEVENLACYIKILDARFGNVIRFDLEVDQSVYSCSIIKLSLQPLVENAVSHGLAMQKDGGRITISIGRQNDDLFVRVADNGIGMNQEDLQKLQADLKEDKIKEHVNAGSGVGLVNINRRLKLYYGGEYGIHISENAGVGLTVGFEIPIQGEGGNHDLEKKYPADHQ